MRYVGWCDGSGSDEPCEIIKVMIEVTPLFVA